MTTTDTGTAIRPYEIAPDTFLIPWSLEAPPVGRFCMNSLVIRGAEPVIVDTGPPANRDAWLADVFSVVEPEDVRWIFLSHDDRDHAGNLLPVLEACPNATLLTNWFSIGRMADEWMTPVPRCRFLNEGDRLDAGDRTLVALRPPIYDSPTTRALFDTSTGVLWAVDVFASPIPEPMESLDDLDSAAFTDGQRLGGQLIAPWNTLVDNVRFGAEVDALRALPIEVAASAHAPVLRGHRLAQAFDLLRELPTTPAWQPFTQADLDQWLAAAPH